MLAVSLVRSRFRSLTCCLAYALAFSLALTLAHPGLEQWENPGMRPAGYIRRPGRHTGTRSHPAIRAGTRSSLATSPRRGVSRLHREYPVFRYLLTSRCLSTPPGVSGIPLPAHVEVSLDPAGSIRYPAFTAG